MRVKIIKAKHQALWYADMIGKVVDVVDNGNGHTFTCIDNGHGMWMDDVEAVDRCGDCVYRETCLMREKNKTWLRGMAKHEL